MAVCHSWRNTRNETTRFQCFTTSYVVIKSWYLLNIFTLLKKIEKKNRKTFLTFIGVLLISSLEISFSFVNKEIRIINETVKISNVNRIRIEKIESDVSSNSLQLQNIVTRLSFNAYIKHTDDRFKDMNNTNEKLLQTMGSLNGRVSGLEQIVYALNMFELNATKNKR